MKRLFLVLAIAFWCSSAPAQQRPPGVFCAPSTFTPSAQPPMAGWCMWWPNYYAFPAPQNASMCDSRIPPVQGEVEIFDQPFTNGGTTPPYGIANCAKLNWSAGGYFDWAAFQLYGWANPGAVIRSLNLGPHTRINFGDHAFDPDQPGLCDSTIHTCVGTVNSGTASQPFPDLWWGLPNFAMASLWIQPQ
jgi:hypothetical protein